MKKRTVIRNLNEVKQKLFQDAYLDAEKVYSFKYPADEDCECYRVRGLTSCEDALEIDSKFHIIPSDDLINAHAIFLRFNYSIRAKNDNAVKAMAYLDQIK